MSGHAPPTVSRPSSTAPARPRDPASLPRSGLGHGLQPLAARWREAAAWWRAGARATVPPRWAAAWGGRRRPTLVLSRADGAWSCLRVEGGRAEALDFGPEGFTLAGLAAWLAARGLARPDVQLAVALARHDLFLRTMTLPEAALPGLDALLAQEVVRRTPFAPGEIWHGGEVLPGPGPVRTVRHWIVRRDFVRRSLAALGLDEAAVDAVAVAEAAGPPVPVIPLRRDDGQAARTDPARLLRALGATALVVTALALAGADGVEGLRAAAVSQALAAAQHDADPGTGGRDLKALLSIKAVPGLGAAWAELSRYLPDDTYLTELRFDDGTVSVRGVSGSAASLVRIVDASPLFTGAALTGGIEPDAGGGRDQFALSVDLRARPPRRGRAAAGPPP